MKNGITKEELIESLEATLKLTREEIACLDLRDEDTVVVYYTNGCSAAVNIAADSGIAIIRDVCRHI